MAKKLMLIVTLGALLFSVGCWDQREINASAIPLAIGIDLLEDKNIVVSTLLAQPRPPEETGSRVTDAQVVSANDPGVAIATRRLMLSISQVPLWAHVRTFILGERLAGNDLSLAIDFMTRNRNIRPDINLLICAQTNPEKVLLQAAGLEGGGLRELVYFSEDQAGIYVPITLREFTYRLMTPGIEPAVPIIILQPDPSRKLPEKKGDKNAAQANNKQEKITLHEMAVFKGNRMIGTLNERESRGYRWLNSQFKTGGLFNVNSPLQPEDDIALEVIRFSSKTRPQISGDQLQMRIDIEANLAFYEVNSSGQLLSPEMISQLEKEANSEIKHQITACIRRSQQLNSDVLGWGWKMQAYQPYEWKQLQSKWGEVFPYVEADIHVQTHIRRSYLTRKVMEFK